jgi:hypothetical protein
MQLGIRVGAAITYDDQPIIQIGGVANGRQHDAAGVNTSEHQRVDAVGAQQRLQVGANCWSASSMLPISRNTVLRLPTGLA